MNDIQISACQFRIERYKSFDDFKKQVDGLLKDVPRKSDYVVFPELFTLALMSTFPKARKLPVTEYIRTDQFTDDYRNLFGEAAVKRKQIIIAGSNLEARKNKYYNVCHIFTPDGREFEHIKTHIFPAEADWFTSEGDDLQVYDLGPVKFGLAVCYEAEIPEISRILAVNGADIVFCPSFTFTEYGFWRVRHCAQARAIENQIYFVHCCTVGEPGPPLANGYGRSSVLSPCDTPWTPNGIVAEAETNKNVVITGKVNLDLLYQNRIKGVAPTFRDRDRRSGVYGKYGPYVGIK